MFECPEGLALPSFLLLSATDFALGQSAKMDLCTVSQGGKRTVSFLAQVLGLMAELDLGTLIYSSNIYDSYHVIRY